MAWNEPGGDKGKDPWSNGNQKPPAAELDEALKKLKSHLGRLVGAGIGNKSPKNTIALAPWGVLLAVIIVLWFLAGFFKVDPAEKAVILRFGAYHDTVGAGIHWVPRIMDSVYKINDQKIYNYSYDGDMLTKDENIVTVAVAVQYRVDDAKNFLFNVTNPVQGLQQATASALRQVIGNTILNQVITTSGAEAGASVETGLGQQVEQQLTQIIAPYRMGIEVTQVSFQSAKAPDKVKEAFDDAIKAREDAQTNINKAKAYAMQVVPQAQGARDRLIEEAKAYEQQVELNAQGETARYLALLPSYNLNPQITRERLYMAMMTQVLNQSSKIVVDMTQKGNGQALVYLPLDKLMSANNQANSMKSTDAIPELSADSTLSLPTVNSSLANYGNQNGSNNNPYGLKDQRSN